MINLDVLYKALDAENKDRGVYCDMDYPDDYELTPKPTASEKKWIDNKYTELLAEFSANKYQRDRAAEFPSITDVTVALAEKAEGDSTMWDEIAAKRQQVKEKYPKS